MALEGLIGGMGGLGSPDWDNVKQSLICRSDIISSSDIDCESLFALTYHSITSIRTRVQKNVGAPTGEPPTYSGETIVASKTQSGHQLIVRVATTPEGKIEVTACSDNDDESSKSLEQRKKRIIELFEAIKKVDEKTRKKATEIAKIEMKLDITLTRILTKKPIGDIYPFVGIIRESLIRVIDGFDPIHIETGEVMESLHKSPQDNQLDEENSRSLALKILDWRRRLSKFIDKLSPPPV